MRVCDRHTDRPSAEKLSLFSEGIDADLCAECKALVLQFLGHSEKKPIDPTEKPKRSILGLRKN